MEGGFLRLTVEGRTWRLAEGPRLRLSKLNLESGPQSRGPAGVVPGPSRQYVIHTEEGAGRGAEFHWGLGHSGRRHWSAGPPPLSPLWRAVCLQQQSLGLGRAQSTGGKALGRRALLSKRTESKGWIRTRRAAKGLS